MSPPRQEEKEEHHELDRPSPSPFSDGTRVLFDDEQQRAFAITKRLGEGSFGVCVKLREQSGGRNDGAEYAAKILPKRNLSKKHMSRLRRLDKATKAALLNVADEISLHGPLRHPGIVTFEGWFSDRLTGKLALVLEYCKHGTLRSLMRQLRELEGGDGASSSSSSFSSSSSSTAFVLPTSVVQRWGAQMLAALAYLHEPPVLIAHRDLNPDNLLVDAALNLRICDFGLAARLADDDSGHLAGTSIIQNSVGTGTMKILSVRTKQPTGRFDRSKVQSAPPPHPFLLSFLPSLPSFPPSLV